MITRVVRSNIHLYHTENRQSSEFYDCLYHNNHWYCLNPTEPMNLTRDEDVWKCDHNGIKHDFRSLRDANISVSTILNQWKSSLEMAEAYAWYLEQSKMHSIEDEEKYLCQCIEQQSFGKYCEYYLPFKKTFAENAILQAKVKAEYPWHYQQYGNILCYRNLPCDSGLLCLDWREICDGVQQCSSGIDEDNCDHLEFNECDTNEEYRCMNGMCIPKEYFLDGIHDCMDLSDEKQNFDDRLCGSGQVNIECDERLCASDQWSCGDGQCIRDRFTFQKVKNAYGGCVSRRDRFFMCETDDTYPLWTLPTGRCSVYEDLEDAEMKNRTTDEECLHYIKCILSRGSNRECPCQYDSDCFQTLENPCPKISIQYPRGAILAPYIFFYYSETHVWSRKTADFIQINGTIRCRGGEKFVQMKLPYPDKFHLRDIEAQLCLDSWKPCANESETFHQRKYAVMNVCQGTLRCISRYRIHDGIRDCNDGTDETLHELVHQTCASMKQYRFQCSMHQASCYYPNLLGDGRTDCSNNYDELLITTDTLLIDMHCDRDADDDCILLRQYIEQSWTDHSDTAAKLSLTGNKAIPFRAYCDTFWNLASSGDEDLQMCRQYWKCPVDQWQCATGQCIDTRWVLDAEWDCFDASDEENIIASNASTFNHNSQLISTSRTLERYELRSARHTFAKICDFNSELACFRPGSFDQFGNRTTIRPCIKFTQINDGQIDCLGGIDEQNRIKHCNGVSMLGSSFKCLSNNACLDYGSICKIPCQHPSDDEAQCANRWHTLPNCSDQIDFVCLNNTCIKSGWCNGIPECPHGEDEYLCELRFRTSNEPAVNLINRYEKGVDIKTKWRNLSLPTFPADIKQKKTSLIVTSSKAIDDLAQYFSSIVSYTCNRGVAIQKSNGVIVCFCPPQYYGDKCQYQSDRLMILVHLNFSQSIYESSNSTSLTLKVLVLLLLYNEVFTMDEFHVRPYTDIDRINKKIIHLTYSHSNESLFKRKSRHLNQSNIINEQPYSIRFQAYELNGHQRPKTIAIWQYPIYFDYLPSFRFAKVLRLMKRNESINPCLSNPCLLNQKCHWLQNDYSRYVCLCRVNFGGKQCSEEHPSCVQGYCRSNALCMPKYQGNFVGNHQPYCICPYNTFGSRCLLVHDKCRSNPCQNRGTCVPSTDRREYHCSCHLHYHGENCEFNQNFIALNINESRISHDLAVVQYLRIDLKTFNLILVHQKLYSQLPNQLFYLHGRDVAPTIVLTRLYSKMNVKSHILSIHYNRSSINGTTYLNESTHCIDIRRDVSNGKRISVYQYHDRCQKQPDLICFTDDNYLCICTDKNMRAECFSYDSNWDQCTRCLANGRCVQGDLKNTKDFRCLCPKCHDGSLCQFNSVGLGFTLDFLIINSPFVSQILSSVTVILFFFIGASTNTASFMTFKRPKPRKVGVANYLLVTSILNQCSLLALLLKIVHIVFGDCKTDLICKLVSYFLSFTTRSSYWLTSWVTVERVLTVIFPFASLPRKPHLALAISIITITIISMMHIHELIFYVSITDAAGNSVCATTMVSTISMYNRLTILIHYLGPFCIQFVSITLLVLFAARSRSRTHQHQKSFRQHFHQQLKIQKELYLTPLIIILSGLPQIILSFGFACTNLSIWQRHALLSTYFLSYAPQLLGFVLFVLPSKTYLNEFRQTSFFRNRLFVSFFRIK